MPREMKWALSLLAGLGLLWLGWKVYAILVFTHVIICLILMSVILLQSGEAADIAGAFGGSGSQTAFGPRGAATFLSRATTWCAVMFMFTSGGLAVHVRTTTASGGHSVLEQFSKPTPKPSAPATPVGPAPIIPGVPAPTAPSQSAPVAPAPAAPAQPAPAQPGPAAPPPTAPAK